MAKHDENYIPPELKKVTKMLSDLGTLFITGALLTSFSIIYFSFKELKISNNLVPKKIYKLSLFQLFFTISSFLFFYWLIFF